jgi:hypothetical protein
MNGLRGPKTGQAARRKAENIASAAQEIAAPIRFFYAQQNDG